MKSYTDSGSYVLILYLPADKRIRIGKLGEIEFKAGRYAYVGSAMRGIDQRVARHRRGEKRFHWHIDYLLKEASIEKVVKIESLEKTECLIAGLLRKRYGSIPHFGSSDCGCQSHLYDLSARHP
jgi:Uri superfamily endonuclease